MNHSIYSADRTTHLKIVVVALLASIGLMGFAFSERIYIGGAYSQVAHLTNVKNPQMENSLSCCLSDEPLCST